MVRRRLTFESGVKLVLICGFGLIVIRFLIVLLEVEKCGAM